MNLLTGVVWSLTSIVVGVVVATSTLYVGNADVVERSTLARLQREGKLTDERAKLIRNGFRELAVQVKHNALMSLVLVGVLAILTVFGFLDVPVIEWNDAWFLTKAKAIYCLALPCCYLILASAADTVYVILHQQEIANPES